MILSKLHFLSHDFSVIRGASILDIGLAGRIELSRLEVDGN